MTTAAETPGRIHDPTTPYPAWLRPDAGATAERARLPTGPGASLRFGPRKTGPAGNWRGSFRTFRGKHRATSRLAHTPEPGRPGLAGGHVGQRLPGHAHAPQPLDHARPLTSLRWWSLDSHLLALSAPSGALDRPRPPCHSYSEYSQRGSEYVGPPDPSGPSAVKRSPAAVRRTCLPLIVQPPEEVLVREPITIRTTLTRQTFSQLVKCSHRL